MFMDISMVECLLQLRGGRKESSQGSESLNMTEEYDDVGVLKAYAF